MASCVRPVLSLVLSCLAGCAGPEPLPLAPPERESTRRPWLAIAPIVRAYPPSGDRPRRLMPTLAPDERWRCGSCEELVVLPPLPCAECGGDPLRATFAMPYRPRTDVEAARVRAGAILEQRGVFVAVTLVPALDPGPGDSDPAQLRQAWRAAAADTGARLLLETVLEDARVELLAKNAWYPLRVFDLIVGALAIIPVLDPLDGLIACEEYGVVQGLAWRVVDLASGVDLATGRLERVTRATFNDFGPGPSRGYIFFGIVRTPGCLTEEEWADIHAQLVDVATEDLAGAVVEAAEEGSR